MNPYTDLGVLDFLLLPFLLALVYGFAYSYRNRHYRDGHPWRPYFIPALSVKIFGAIFIGLIYAYYYKGGDTFNYFNHSQVINSALDESFSKWLNLVLRIPSPSDGEYYQYISKMDFYRNPGTYIISAITAVLSLLTFETYLPTAVQFAIISFTGVWALFRTFAKLHPQFVRIVAVSILFIPSVIIWGSGIFKDTICIMSLGWLTYCTYSLIIDKDYSIQNIITATLSLYLLVNIKVYIIIAYAPAVLFWLLSLFSNKFRNEHVKRVVVVFFTLGTISSTFQIFDNYSNFFDKYSLENIDETSRITRNYISYKSQVDDGSGYTLSKVEQSILGKMLQFPEAVNVTLFRPYFWEAKKSIVLLSAIESFLFLLITLKVILAIGIKRIVKTISNDYTIQFCLIFSIIFSYAVGISTYNFGALSRYKIPGLSFYLLGILLIWYKNQPQHKKIIRILNI